MVMEIVFWISAAVICFAMMQTIFRLLLVATSSENYNSCKQRELDSLPNSAVITNHYLRSIGQSSSRAAYVPD
jgi:hypothetical protein